MISVMTSDSGMPRAALVADLAALVKASSWLGQIVDDGDVDATVSARLVFIEARRAGAGATAGAQRRLTRPSSGCC